MKKPVGILHVRVICATKLLKKDLLGLSDPYVKLSLSGEKLHTKKTTVKKKTLNPEWNEEFKLSVKDPQSQMLHINVYDWDKVTQTTNSPFSTRLCYLSSFCQKRKLLELSLQVGSHDRLGTQLVPLKVLTPNVAKEVTLDLLKDTSISVPGNKKQRGQLFLELKYAPFREDSDSSSGTLDRKQSIMDRAVSNISASGAGLLLVTVQGAHDVEGSKHNNPYVLIIFRGETKKSKVSSQLLIVFVTFI